MKLKLLLLTVFLMVQPQLTCVSYGSEPYSTSSETAGEIELRSYAESQDTDYKAFRFTLLRGELEDKLIYTLILRNGNEKPSLTIKKYRNGKDQFVEKKIWLTERQLINLRSFERASNFWKLPTEHGVKGFDGATWTLEGVDGPIYHRTNRWSPLPPYYSSVMDPKTHELVKSPHTPPGSDFKYSDEVGLDMFCLLIILMQPGFDDLIY
ncbi:hypothetical protein [Pseudomonas sp. PIC25]|uniref:hypothetical protein n=1 Tax=Pseudomonas sp. PIC25 TaxID=1958773 RepID=UPI00117BD6C0|nr:hypothetical protein [Pseudomonas sp. PIC25]